MSQLKVIPKNTDYLTFQFVKQRLLDMWIKLSVWGIGIQPLLKEDILKGDLRIGLTSLLSQCSIGIVGDGLF
jgi:hypothetical protein